jgi:hypothetical protein
MSGSFLTGLPREANQGDKEGDFAKSLNYCTEAALGGLGGISQVCHSEEAARLTQQSTLQLLFCLRFSSLINQSPDQLSCP